MRYISGFLIFSLVNICTAQPDSGFSGIWKLNAERSEIRALPAPPSPVLKVEQNAKTLAIAGGLSYPLDGRTEKRQSGNSTTNIVTKWEGSALLINTIVNGPTNYTVMERWKRSRDGGTLTIKRTVVSAGGESESLLIYENPALLARAASEPAAAIAQTAPPPAGEYVIATGTRMLLRLTNSVNTKHTAVGDRVYLETASPIFINERLVIPRGSYVTGTVTESERAGRVKGKASLNLRFDSLTLPNGVTRDFHSRPGSADSRGNLDRSEGKIHGESNKGGDAKTIGEATAAGAGIGTLAGSAAGHYGMGAGIGAAAGAAAGLIGVLASRGPDVILQQGTTMELVLDRDLRFTSAELRRAVQ